MQPSPASAQIVWSGVLYFDASIFAQMSCPRAFPIPLAGSMFLYSWLHLTGYPLSLEELKRFRAA